LEYTANNRAKTDMKISDFETLGDAFLGRAEKQPDRAVYQQAHTGSNGEERIWKTTSYKESKEQVLKLAHYLKTLGVKKGTRVAIIANTRPEWMECDIAVLLLGGVVVSVYQSLPANEIAFILFDSEAKIVIAENKEQVDKLLDLGSRSCTMPATEERDETQAQVKLDKIISLETVEESELVICKDNAINQIAPLAEADIEKGSAADLASLVYTSGTTGAPKGVMQNHGNHLANIRQAQAAEMFADDSTIMLFLPLAHSFAKLMGYVGFLTGVVLKFPAVTDRQSSKADPSSVMKDVSEGSANIVPIVPRILEKMQQKVMEKSSAGGLQGSLLGMSISSAVKRYEAQKKKESAGILNELSFKATSGLRKKIVNKLFGPNLQYIVSGGAKLSLQTAEFYQAIGVEILQGYGLTETCVATNVNRLSNNKLGTVGPVLDDDIEMRIADDGEIQFRGPNIAPGYFKREKATSESWDKDGWFKTGDLGSVDEDGFLTIVGRKKEILVLSNGKNIQPEHVEQKIKKSDLISQVVLVGDGKPHCGALVVPDDHALKSWAKSNNESIDSEDKIHGILWREVEKANSDLASHERVKKIAVIEEEFTIENGLLTPTFKVKKKEVEKKYNDKIEALYREG